MAALTSSQKKNKVQNCGKVLLAIKYLKKGLCSFLQNEVESLHTYLKQKIHHQTTPLQRCTHCNFSLVVWDKDAEEWELHVGDQCKSQCAVWFRELLQFHAYPKSKNICWENCDIPLWPLEPWECAKVFMPKGQVPSHAMPIHFNAESLLLLLNNCRHFFTKLSSDGHGLLRKISMITQKVMNDNELELSDTDRERFIKQIIALLEDPVCLKSRQDCIDAVHEIHKMSREDFVGQSGMNMFSEELCSLYPKDHCVTDNIPETIYAGANKTKKCGADQLKGDMDQQNLPPKETKPLPDNTVHDALRTAQTMHFRTPRNPRCGKIIQLTAEEMEKCIEDQIEIGKGAFGKVYLAKITPENPKMLDGNKRQFAIKKIKITAELSKKSYEREIQHGRILHPFINPIIARAESDQNQSSEERYSYLMFPYMKNKDLRSNIDNENNKKRLSEYESNSKIWMRCIYQIALALDYLHTYLRPVRRPVCHRDLTSRNILLDENFNIRLGDFGIAVEAKRSDPILSVTHCLGTPGYHPRTMSRVYCASYDIFSFGVVMLEMLTGQEAAPSGPKYLYEKFKDVQQLIWHLNQRAAEIEVVKWHKENYRDKIAEIALDCLHKAEMDAVKLLLEVERAKETEGVRGPQMDYGEKTAEIALDCAYKAEMDAVKLVQGLEDLRLDSSERYNCPKDLDVCVSCCVNPPVNLPLKGQGCLEQKGNEKCEPFCVHCLMNDHINPLICPKHGKSRPPFGDQVFGIFVAGNEVSGMRKHSYGMQNEKTGAEIFNSDVKNIVDVLTANHPFDFGRRKCHFKVVEPRSPGTEEEMLTRIKSEFKDMNSIIKKTLKDNNMKPKEDRLPSSLFIFYFSGHCDVEKGLYLGSTKETLSASTPWIKQMLHKNIGVDQVLVILDCCHANSQNFANIKCLDEGETSAYSKRNEVRIVQLSSCDTNQESQAKPQPKGSYFTQFLCLGIQGLDCIGSENDVMLCDICQAKKKHEADSSMPCIWYHAECRKDQTVTLKRLRQFIRDHFNLLRDHKDWQADMTPIQNAQGETEIYMGYYKPFQYQIHIHLFGSQGEESFVLRKPYPESIDELKQDVIKYTVEENVQCDVLKFHKCYEKGLDNFENTSCLVGICQNYGGIELISLEDIYKAWASGLKLDARVRENVERVSHGPVRLKEMTKDMVASLLEKEKERKDKDKDNFKLSSDILQIPMEKIYAAVEQIKRIFGDHKNFVDCVQKVVSTCIDNVEDKHKVLSFFIYDQFSVLKLV